MNDDLGFVDAMEFLYEQFRKSRHSLSDCHIASVCRCESGVIAIEVLNGNNEQSSDLEQIEDDLQSFVNLASKFGFDLRVEFHQFKKTIQLHCERKNGVAK